MLTPSSPLEGGATMILLSMLLAAAPSPAPNVGLARLARAVDLYETACLKTFPDDAALDTLMAARSAMPLSAEDVKVTLRDDPGRAWQIGEGAERMFVFLELPPYHACSVRFMMPDAQYDLAGYRAVERRYMGNADYTDINPLEGEQGDLHLRLVGKQRKLADATETLMIVDQHVTDIARRKAGETGVSLRFVRQIKADPSSR
jgi:hypothetical protein